MELNKPLAELAKDTQRRSKLIKLEVKGNITPDSKENPGNYMDTLQKSVLHQIGKPKGNE